jgi:hypothetical protein
MVAVDLVAANEVPAKPAALTADLLIRGRSRARALVTTDSFVPPPIPTHPEKPATASAPAGLRGVGLLTAWVAVFVATFLIGLNLID